ncbi:MAG TPA: lipopolysaccharide kinase InaA family protein [Gammaproteobacteria bacterium]|jgi:tRNA A-37 threonylcarbamoyl transferase component Bud32|nr:lipopolysaccharide kinase InaA family protein [Gammaproteobacteria bacterium]
MKTGFKKICYDSEETFSLSLTNGTQFASEQRLRIIPGKRVVARGRWEDKTVVAKIFFSKNAKKHAESDRRGIAALHKKKIPAPLLLCSDTINLAGQDIVILLFDYIPHAKQLDASLLTTDEGIALLKKIITEIATQHVLGILQKDLHFSNFLIQENDKKTNILTVDGAQIQSCDSILDKETSMHNIALLLSQIGAGESDLQEKLFRFYATLRGWLLQATDLVQFHACIDEVNKNRWENFSQKINRDSTAFVTLRQGNYHGMYQRDKQKPDFLAFLKDPDAIFQSASSHLLKAGNSATVIKIALDGKYFVIKRYNIKNIWHYLRRCLRPTRAACCWRIAQKLKLFHVATADPVAFIEKKSFGLRGLSYYVTDYIEGENAKDYFHEKQSADNVADMLKRIKQLFFKIKSLNISHGDLKITNILIDRDNKPVMIDLDGAIEHDSLSTLHSTWKKELKRFDRNF